MFGGPAPTNFSLVGSAIYDVPLRSAQEDDILTSKFAEEEELNDAIFHIEHDI